MDEKITQSFFELVLMYIKGVVNVQFPVRPTCQWGIDIFLGMWRIQLACLPEMGNGVIIDQLC